MVTKIIMCPHCKNKVTVQANPGEKTYITCPKCNTKGVFIFPEEKSIVKTTDTSFAIEVDGLVKFYNGFKAVDNVSFKVKTGEIFGFLGPNGAGKTTTIKMLTSILKPNQGTARIGGFDIRTNAIDAKKIIGFMPDVPGFYGEMKAEDILHFYAEFYKIDKDTRNTKINELFEMMQLEDFRKKKVKTYSRGMKQKLGFCVALINDPKILILDEPTIGLDPQTIHFFRKMFMTLNQKGVTIFLSSHILSEVQEICTKVGIINHGRIIALDTIDELGKKTMHKKNKKVLITYENITQKAIDAIKKISGIIDIQTNESKKRLEIEIESGKNIIPIINQTLVENNIRVNRIESKEATLEDIFLSLVGKDK